MRALREPMAEANGSAVSCLTCELDFDDFHDPQEARHFATVHNELHAHGQCLGAIADDVEDDADAIGRNTGQPAPATESSADAAQAVDEDGW